MILWFEDDPAFGFEINEFAESNLLDIRLYRDPDDFEAEFTKAMIKDVSLVVMDYDLDGKTILDINLTGYLKDYLGFTGKICIASDLCFLPEFKNKFNNSVDHFIKKSDLTEILLIIP